MEPGEEGRTYLLILARLPGILGLEGAREGFRLERVVRGDLFAGFTPFGAGDAIVGGALGIVSWEIVLNPRENSRFARIRQAHLSIP